MTKYPQRVAVLGASDKLDRYSYKAVRLLKQHGHTVIPVHPALSEVDGTPVAPSLAHLSEPIDTLSLYLNPTRSSVLIDEIVALKPGRVIFNPGTESPKLANALEEHNIPHEDACTLVLLKTQQF
ncbi:MAG: CoA-binding protein [Verrucomicrobiota bacterium]